MSAPHADQKPPSPSAAYWDKKIRRWAASSYAARRADPMAKLRTSIDARKEEAKRLLRAHLAPGYRLLDLGCGSGHFVIEALRECGAGFARGHDFSPAAIELARTLAGELGLGLEKVRFEVAPIEAPLPEADVVTGLGLLDWLEGGQIEDLFARLRGRRFVFSYSEQDGSFAEWVHRAYLVWRLRWFGGGVRAYHHTRQFILERIEKNGLGPVEIVSSRGMRFGRLVHNLKKEPR